MWGGGDRSCLDAVSVLEAWSLGFREIVVERRADPNLNPKVGTGVYVYLSEFQEILGSATSANNDLSDTLLGGMLTVAVEKRLS